MASASNNAGEDFRVTMLKAQMTLDEMYIKAMWGTIQGILPMMEDKTVDVDYRLVIEDRIKTWHALMLDAQTHHAKLKEQLKALLVK